MYIYKITNIVNNKIYIGKVYNKTIYDRFKRHLNGAKKSHTLLAKAICKYGKENFIIEQIDKANNLDELNEKEKYWIKYYNSTNKNIGYNLTSGGDGGNTYLNKTTEEMDKIKEKLRKANFGRKNGMAKPIKALNVKTNEIIHFNTLNEALIYFNVKQKGIFTCRCNGESKYYWNNTWNFAYEDDDFSILEFRDKKNYYDKFYK